MAFRPLCTVLTTEICRNPDGSEYMITRYIQQPAAGRGRRPVRHKSGAATVSIKPVARRRPGR